MVKPQSPRVEIGKLNVFVPNYRIFIFHYPCVLTIKKFNDNRAHETKLYADFESQLVQWLTDKLL